MIMKVKKIKLNIVENDGENNIQDNNKNQDDKGKNRMKDNLIIIIYYLYFRKDSCE